MCKKKILFEVPPTRDDVENKITIKPVEFREIKIVPFAFLLILLFIPFAVDELWC